MPDRHFHLRLNATYRGDDNTIDELQVDISKDQQWQPLELGIRSPGFLLFINGLFSCQHLYMRTNSAERGLVLTSAQGELKVVAGEYWDIATIDIQFVAQLKSGKPTAEAIDYITERMRHCPVSTNIRKDVQISNSVRFVSD